MMIILYKKTQMNENFCILPKERERKRGQKKSSSKPHHWSATDTRPVTYKISMRHS
jgi:hypothetical protein